MYSTCIHAVSIHACVVHVQYVLLLMILIIYTIMLHLWDTGSVGIPINNQIMAEFWDCFRCLDTLLTSTNHRIYMYIAFDDKNSFGQSSLYCSVFS